jgi:excisionase family DNA binding protein
MNELLEDYPAVLDVTTVAEILGVTPATVRRLIKAKVLHSVKVGRLTRITKSKLIEYLGKGACKL